MTVEMLKDCNKKALARMAKDQGIAGWHAMRKDQLIRALTPKPAKPRGKAAEEKAQPAAIVAPKRPAASRSAARSSSKNGTAPAVSPPSRSLAPMPGGHRLNHGDGKDRVVMMVRDAFWLHVHWELSQSTLSRAQAALGQDWHGARPILRLMDVSSEDTTSASERQVRDIEIHGGVNNWYIDVNTPQHSYRVDLGYLSRRGKFYVLARSNVVCMPKAGVGNMIDENWASIQDDAEQIYHRSGGTANPAGTNDLRDLFETRLRRPMNSLSLQSLGTGALGLLNRKFHFEIDAELIVYGHTEPNAKVTLQGEPVKLREDGSFTVRFGLPDARQIIPAVAASPDGVEERTIVLAVERNTKELEPMIHDGNEL